VQSTDHTIHTSHRLLTTKNHHLPPTLSKTPRKTPAKITKPRIAPGFFHSKKTAQN
jgi:hypothetical protein